MRCSNLGRETVVSRIITFPDGFSPERRFLERRFPDAGMVSLMVDVAEVLLKDLILQTTQTRPRYR